MDRNRFFQWAELQIAVPEVVISGRSSQSTTISGVFASQILEDDFRNVKFAHENVVVIF